jgi:hypothetical protein
MVAVTKIGAIAGELEAPGELFSEVPGRFIVATSDVAAFTRRADAAGVAVHQLGWVGGDALVIGSLIDLSVEEIASRRERALVDALELS